MAGQVERPGGPLKSACRPSKAMAEKRAKEEGRSFANYIERLIIEADEKSKRK